MIDSEVLYNNTGGVLIEEDGYEEIISIGAFLDSYIPGHGL